MGKREKKNNLEANIKHEESNRKNQLHVAKEALRIRRDKVSRRQATDISFVAGSAAGSAAGSDADADQDSDSPGSASERIVEQFKGVLNDNADNFLDFFCKIQRLIGKKCDDAEHEVSIVKNESDVLKRRIAGYQNYLAKDHGHNHGHNHGHGHGVAMQMQE